MESFFSSMKTECIARKVYRSRDEARADAFDYVERFCNSKRRRSTIGYISPMKFEMKAGSTCHPNRGQASYRTNINNSAELLQ
jgi:putative transposase